jgi:carboxymethylenebutenolidase
MIRITALSVMLSLFALAANVRAADDGKLPPGEADAKARLEKSPRHGEFVDIEVPGGKVPLRSYVVYPERKEKAPVVIVIHEIFGLTDWIRSVADQLAAEGFIAIAPDLLSGMGPNGGGSDSLGGGDGVRGKIRDLPPDQITADLDAVAKYVTTLPAANGKVSVSGFCWGGGQSFRYATNKKDLEAAFVFYGSPPDSAEDIERIECPVYGFYGENDARINASLPMVDSTMRRHGKRFDQTIYPGTGHGFLKPGRQGNDGPQPEKAWTDIVGFLRESLGR